MLDTKGNVEVYIQGILIKSLKTSLNMSKLINLSRIKSKLPL